MKRQLVVAFPFGDPGTSKSNRMIANIGSDYARGKGCPIYVPIDVWADKHLWLIWADMEKGESPSILEIAQGAVKWALENRIEELWVVTTKSLIKTATENLEVEIRKAGCDITVYVCPEVLKIPENDWIYSSKKNVEPPRLILVGK